MGVQGELISRQGYCWGVILSTGIYALGPLHCQGTGITFFRPLPVFCQGFSSTVLVWDVLVSGRHQGMLLLGLADGASATGLLFFVRDSTQGWSCLWHILASLGDGALSWDMVTTIG